MAIGFHPERATTLLPSRAAAQVAVAAYPADDQHRTHQDAIFLPDLDEHRIDQHERVLAFQASFVEGLDMDIESGAQTADRRFREARPAQFFGDRTGLARRYTLNDHFHQCQNERLFAPSVGSV